MIEPPTKQLLKNLADLKLCTPVALRRCRRHVRRLACDLPAFDSVWIDALVHARKLTPFQARILESAHPEHLSVGPCVLVDRLGHGAASETFLARKRGQNDRCVLKRIDCPLESIATALSRLEELVSRLQDIAHPSFVAPTASLRHGDQLVTVSRYVSGPHLGELLVRRGRVSPEHVIEIARQLVDSLATLEENNCVHGDVNLWNVRLTCAGVAVLVDAGISRAALPVLTIHAGRSPERYDGIAPELIGTGRHSDSSSDAYALGCLLWQLLAGRPPYPTGDPLGKLAAHQTRTVEDVRNWAPGTPSTLAETILALTNRDPRCRPGSFREIRENMGTPNRRGRQRLTRFQALFNTSVRRMPAAVSAPSSNRWTVLLVLLFVLSGAVLTLADRGAGSRPLNFSSRISKISDYFGVVTAVWLGNDDRRGTFNDAENVATAKRAVPRLIPLPRPDGDGVILLNSPGPYTCGQIDVVGPLTIRGLPGLQSEIVVSARPCQIVAEQLTLENVHFRRAVEPLRTDKPQVVPHELLVVQAQVFKVHRCSFQAPEQRPADSQAMTVDRSATWPVALVWKMIDQNEARGGRVTITDTVFSGSMSSLRLMDVPRRVEIQNCLKIGSGPLMTLTAAPRPSLNFHIELRQLTMRCATALLRLQMAANRRDSGTISIDADDCVFDLTGRNAALFQIVATPLLPDRLIPIDMTGAGSLANPNLTVALRLDPNDQSPTELGPAAVRLEGISTALFAYTGPIGRTLRDSEIQSYDSPRRSRTSPGIDAAKLALPAPTATPILGNAEIETRIRQSKYLR